MERKKKMTQRILTTVKRILDMLCKIEDSSFVKWIYMLLQGENNHIVALEKIKIKKQKQGWIIEEIDIQKISSNIDEKKHEMYVGAW